MAAYDVNVEEVEPMSRTYQYRKVMKPMLERKRRARINKCLDELKDLMVGALQSEGESITKLEKADVLELTVKHLKKLKQHHALAIPAQNHATEKFRAGFGHCATEVRRFVEAVPGVDMHISARLFNHLGQWISQMDKVGPTAPQGSLSPITTVTTPTVPLNIPRVYTPPASPEAKMNYSVPVQQPHALNIKTQPISPPPQQQQHYQLSAVVSPLHSHHYNAVPSAVVSSSGIIHQSRQPSSVIVSTIQSPRIHQAPNSQDPINYSPKSASPSGIIKVEVPQLSPVWRPW